jgi:uncharacterized repeat protein (TIGR02543 family)
MPKIILHGNGGVWTTYNEDGSTSTTDVYDYGEVTAGDTISVSKDDISSPTIAAEPDRFWTGFNTTADGTGTAIAFDQEFVMPPADYDLYTVWSIPVTLTLKPNGATGTDSTGTYNSVPAGAESFDYPGKYVVSWNTAADGSGTSYIPYADTTKAMDGLTLYAQWAEVKIKIYYTVAAKGTDGTKIFVYSNGVELSSKEEEMGALQGVPSGSTLTITKPRRTFVNWSNSLNSTTTTDMTLSNSQAEAVAKVNGVLQDVTFTANVTCDAYTIHYDKNADKATGTATDENTYFGVNVYLGLRFAYTGYVLGGWNTAADGSGTAYQVNDTAYDIAPYDASEVTLYAQWGLPYYVTFDGNGSTSGTMYKQSMPYGFKRALPINAYARTDYDFAGWNTAADGSGTTYANKESVTNLAAAGETVTLYAQWKVMAQAYTIRMLPNDGTGVAYARSVTALIGTPYTLPYISKTFTRVGYAATGWNTAADGSGTAYADGASVLDLAAANAEITLYAQWGTPYSVRFDGNGGSGTVSPITTANGAVVIMPANAFAYDKKEFASWNTLSDGSGTSYAPGDKVTANFITTPAADGSSYFIIYAQWKDTTPREILLSPNHDDLGTAQTLTGIDGTKVQLPSSLPKVPYPGYAISGWNTSADGKGTGYALGASYTIAGDATLYAQWVVSTELSLTYAPGTDGSFTAATVTVPYGSLPPETDPVTVSSALSVAHFTGWKSATGEMIDKTTVLTADQTYTAQWERYPVRITFDSTDGNEYGGGKKGGHGPTNPSTVAYGGTLPEPTGATAETADGATLLGYYTQPCGKGKPYATYGTTTTYDKVVNVETFPTLADNPQLTFYAHWSSEPAYEVDYQFLNNPFHMEETDTFTAHCGNVYPAVTTLMSSVSAAMTPFIGWARTNSTTLAPATLRTSPYWIDRIGKPSTSTGKFMFTAVYGAYGTEYNENVYQYDRYVRASLLPNGTYTTEDDGAYCAVVLIEPGSKYRVSCQPLTRFRLASTSDAGTSGTLSGVVIDSADSNGPGRIDLIGDIRTLTITPGVSDQYLLVHYATAYAEGVPYVSPSRDWEWPLSTIWVQKVVDSERLVTINLLHGDGSGTTSPVKSAYDGQTQLPGTVYSHGVARFDPPYDDDHNKFIGWQTSDGTLLDEFETGPASVMTTVPNRVVLKVGAQTLPELLSGDTASLTAMWLKAGNIRLHWRSNGMSTGVYDEMKDFGDMYVGAPVDIPTIPLADGYIFLGWTDDPDSFDPTWTDGKVPYVIPDSLDTPENAVIPSDKYAAIIGKDERLVRFVGNGFTTFDTITKPVKMNTSPTSPTSAELTTESVNVTVTGWQDENGTTYGLNDLPVVPDTTEPTAVTTYAAITTCGQVTLTFDPNDRMGTLGTTMTVTYGDTLTTPQPNAYAYGDGRNVAEGWSRDGSTHDSALNPGYELEVEREVTVRVSSAYVFTDLELSSSTTLKAVWSKLCTLSYTGSYVDIQTYTGDTGLLYGEPTPGYTNALRLPVGVRFAGWGTTMRTDVTGHEVLDGTATANDLKTKIDAETTSAYPYLIETTTVTYSPGAHGTFSKVTTEVEIGDATPAAPNVTGDAGWKFSSWSPAQTSTVTKSVEYVAQWTAIATCLVKFRPGSHGTFAETTVKADVGSVMPTWPGFPDDPASDSTLWTFAGWTPTIPQYVPYAEEAPYLAIFKKAQSKRPPWVPGSTSPTYDDDLSWGDILVTISKRGWTEGCRLTVSHPSFVGSYVGIMDGTGTVVEYMLVTEGDDNPLVTHMSILEYAKPLEKITAEDATVMYDGSWENGACFAASDVTKSIDFEIPYTAKRLFVVSAMLSPLTLKGVMYNVAGTPLNSGAIVEWHADTTLTAEYSTLTGYATFRQIDDSETWGSENTRRLNLPYQDFR